MGEGQGTDTSRELDWGLQLQKHDVVVMIQVSGAALVQRVGDRAEYIPHLLASLHIPQGVLAQVNSVSTVGAGRERLEERMSPFPPQPLLHPTFLISKHISCHILNSSPLQTLSFNPVSSPVSCVHPKPHSHPFPSQP